MAWITKDDAERQFFGEMKELPDRVVGLLAPVIIDERLTSAIQAQWHDVKNEHGGILGQLFRDGGQLGSFGTRIDIGFAIGLYSEAVYRDLRYMSKIRNKFAHKLEPRDFANQQIVAWINNLTVFQRYPILPDHEIAMTPMNPSKYELMRNFTKHSSVSDMADPRSRFIRTAEILSIMLLSEADLVTRKIPQF